MVDPISLIGTAGSVANIIDLVAKTVNTIRELANEYKIADLQFFSLVSQLTALRAAFDKILEWMDSDLGDPHHQLVMDIDLSMSCCRMLIGKIDDMLAELRQVDNGKLDFSSKVKLVFGSKNIESIQKLIERQTGALTLLLTACNCKTISEQRAMLEKSSTRKLIRRMEIDTASLVVHRDTDSFITQMTDNLSKLSAVFTFDHELFVSKVYERALRGSVKKSLKIQQEYPDPRKRSQAIDYELWNDKLRSRKECKVLLFGDESSGKDQLVNQMKIAYQDGYTIEYLITYRLTIYKNVIDSIKCVIEAMWQFEIELENEANRKLCDLLMNYTVDSDSPLGETIGDAISSIWNDPCIPKVMKHSSAFYMMDSAPYFFHEVKRIASNDYIPTEADVLRTKPKTNGIHETSFTRGWLTIRLFDVSGQRSKRKKWIHQFQHVTSIIYVVNLAGYDQVLPEDPTQNRMMESLALFDSIVNSHWFYQTSIILFLNNMSGLREKLVRSPLSNYFPDYSGGADVNRAAKYIVWRFNECNRGRLDLYPCFADSNGSSSLKLMFDAVKDTVSMNDLRVVGIRL